MQGSLEGSMGRWWSGQPEECRGVEFDRGPGGTWMRTVRPVSLGCSSILGCPKWAEDLNRQLAPSFWRSLGQGADGKPVGGKLVRTSELGKGPT